MRPQRVDHRAGKGLVVVHVCVACGFTRPNRIADDYLSEIDDMIERGIADPARIGTMGVSYGGYMSAWLVTQDQRFKAAVAGSPVTEWYSFTFTTNIPRWGLWFLGNADPEEIGNQVHTRSPVMHASKARTPTLLTAGAKDRCRARPGEGVLSGTDRPWRRLGTGGLP